MNLQSSWIKYGVMYGIAGILLQLVMFYILPLGLWTQMLVGIAIMVVFFVLAGKAQRAENGGTLTYGEALKITYLTGLVGAVIGGLFSIVLINLVDPSLVDKLTEMAMESTRSMMESFGTPEDVANDALDKVEEDMAGQFTPFGQLMTILKSALFMIIPAALVSIFLKKEADPNKIDLNDISGNDA